MKKCAQCQAPLDSSWKFCVNCGTPSSSDAPAVNPSLLTSVEQSPLLSEKREQHQTRAAAKAAAASATAVKTRRGSGRTATALPEEIPAAIRNSQDGPPPQAAGRRKVDVPLIVSISLGAAGTILIVYLVILIFGSHG